MEAFGFLIIPALLLAFMLGYNAGQSSKDYPSEEEMMRRIIESRVRKRVTDEVDKALKDEINRQAAS